MGKCHECRVIPLKFIKEDKMKSGIAIVVCVLTFSCTLFGKDNRLSLAVGYPDMFGIEYQRNIHNFYIAFAPHFLASIIYCLNRDKNYNYNLAIFPSLSCGYNFIKRGIFELGPDLIITPGYFKRTYSDSSQGTQFELNYGLRIVPSFTFSKISLSLFGGFYINHVLKPYDYPHPITFMPSIALKVGYNF
jgi:hypothetical protein